MRFNKDEGNIGVVKKSAEDVKFKNEMRVENTDFKISKCEADDLITFYKEHGSHLEHCLSKNKFRNQRGKGKKNTNKFELKKPVELGGES